jgi:hypothetical protein
LEKIGAEASTPFGATMGQKLFELLWGYARRTQKWSPNTIFKSQIDRFEVRKSWRKLEPKPPGAFGAKTWKPQHGNKQI